MRPDASPGGPTDGSNVYVALDTRRTPHEVAEIYRRHGWTVRASGWAEMEMRRDGAEMTVEGADPVLLHGLLPDPEAQLDVLLAPLRAVGVAFTAEVYGPPPDAPLLREVRG